MRCLRGQAGRIQTHSSRFNKKLRISADHIRFAHRVNDRGVALASPIADVPTDVSALHNLATRQVGTAAVAAETFPALLSTKIPAETKVDDLTNFPPVLRTFSPTAVDVRGGSTWKHSKVLGNYSDEELGAILTFLRAVG